MTAYLGMDIVLGFGHKATERNQNVASTVDFLHSAPHAPAHTFLLDWLTYPVAAELISPI